MTTLVNKYHGVSYDVDISRSSIWGNPYSSKEGTSATHKVETKEIAISSYFEYLKSRKDLWLKLKDIKDKSLGCTCYPKSCHGDILVYVTNLIGNRTWSRKSPNGYEVSSKGDMRFSAFNARLSDGRSIEQHYQCDIKGYSSISEGKGKNPINPKYLNHEANQTSSNSSIVVPLYVINRDLLYQDYRNLWIQWAGQNPDLLFNLATQSIGKELTDMFATSDINQARALTEILNKCLI